ARFLFLGKAGYSFGCGDRSVGPIGNKNIGFMRNFAVAIGSPNEALAVGGEHGEAIEIGVEGDAFLARAVFVYDVEVEIAAVFGISLIGGEDDALAIGQEIRGEIRRAVASDLVLVGAIGVHHPDFEVAGTDQALREEVLVVLDLLGRLRMLGAVDDFLAVVRPKRAAIIAEFVGELLHIAAVGVHGVNVQVAIAGGGENDVLAVARDGGFCVVARGMGQLPQVGAVGLGGVNVIDIVDRPDVAARIVGLGRARGAGGMRGGKENFVAR